MFSLKTLKHVVFPVLLFFQMFIITCEQLLLFGAAAKRSLNTKVPVQKQHNLSSSQMETSAVSDIGYGLEGMITAPLQSRQV